MRDHRRPRCSRHEAAATYCSVMIRTEKSGGRVESRPGETRMSTEFGTPILPREMYAHLRAD
jgi:hypothetical protein